MTANVSWFAAATLVLVGCTAPVARASVTTQQSTTTIVRVMSREEVASLVATDVRDIRLSGSVVAACTGSVERCPLGRRSVGPVLARIQELDTQLDVAATQGAAPVDMQALVSETRTAVKGFVSEATKDGWFRDEPLCATTSAPCQRVLNNMSPSLGHLIETLERWTFFGI